MRESVRAVICVLALVGAATSAQAATPEALAYFENEVRPLLVAKCFKCHGEKKSQGGLRLDSLGHVLAGGESGPAVLPGKPQESLMIEAVRYESLEMPPTGRLDNEEIRILERWVEVGAPWPGQAPGRLRDQPEKITEADRKHWSFQPLNVVEPPTFDDESWIRNEIDRFILRRLHEAGLTPAAEAPPRQLIRRVHFDLTGLQPTPQAAAQFAANRSPANYGQLVESLLQSPGYGERWARHWLDLVRYAESDGYKLDAYRPHVWRYRDYVIESFNKDKPYDQFVMEQLAGDEVAPDDLTTLTATGYLRHWIYESNQRDARAQWSGILDDVTNVTGEVFLALSMGCARCHDHKFDPILREDFYRLRAFFAGIMPRDDLLYASPAAQASYHSGLREWEERTSDLRAEIAEIETPLLARRRESQIERFPPDLRPLLRRSPDERTPLEKQLAYQVRFYFDRVKMESELKGDTKRRWVEVTQQLADGRPEPPAPIFAVTDAGLPAPSTTIPGDRSGREILPGFLTLLSPGDATIDTAEVASGSSGRRHALAKWITDPANPLTPRVIVNRIWQRHFGRGIVETSSNFGRLGSEPTHPELLDWLANWFMEHRWSVKELDRLIVNSATYRQASMNAAPRESRELDSQNQLLSHMPIRRLDAEQIRDASLVASGELDFTREGPGVEGTEPRRAIYTKVLRNSRDPLSEAFDGPDGFSSTSRRSVTTTPTQALVLINGDWMVDRAEAMAKRIQERALESDYERINFAFELALSRPASGAEVDRSMNFLGAIRADNEPTSRDAWVDFCHVLLNSNEFLYLD